MGEDADGAGERVRPPRRAPLSWDSHALNPENKKWRHARARDDDAVDTAAHLPVRFPRRLSAESWPPPMLFKVRLRRPRPSAGLPARVPRREHESAS